MSQQSVRWRGLAGVFDLPYGLPRDKYVTSSHTKRPALNASEYRNFEVPLCTHQLSLGNTTECMAHGMPTVCFNVSILSSSFVASVIRSNEGRPRVLFSCGTILAAICQCALCDHAPSHIYLAQRVSSSGTLTTSPSSVHRPQGSCRYFRFLDVYPRGASVCVGVRVTNGEHGNRGYFYAILPFRVM